MYVIVILFVVFFLFISSVTKQAKKQQEERRKQEQAKAEAAAKAKKEKEARLADEAFRSRTAAGRIASHEGEDPCHDDLYGERAPFQSFSTFQSFGEGTDPCHDDLYSKDQPSGSIDGAGMFAEGIDPCHDDLFASSSANTLWEDAHPDMNGFIDTHNENAKQELLRAVVLSEVLNRPAAARKRAG